MKITRLQALHSYKTHPLNDKLYTRLTIAELHVCEQFIYDNDHLDVNAFAEQVNRWGLDGIRSKHHSDMWALVMQANQLAHYYNEILKTED